MTKSNNGALKASATMDLRARANRLRDDAGRFIKRDQPQPEALPDKMPGSRNTDPFRKEDAAQHEARRGHAEDHRRDPAATGRVPSGEQDMGRHETFENATPLADELLTATALGRVRLLGTVSTDAASPPDLADACVEQIARLDHWDANSRSFSEEEGSAEMDRWDAVFRRAIEEPSAGPRDLAGKAFLMLADLRRFHPEEDYQTDDWRLMRIILREAISMGGLAGAQPQPALSKKPTASMSSMADAEIVALAADFCEAYARNGRIDREMMAGRATEAEWKPCYDAMWSLFLQLQEAQPKTVLGMALKCLLLATSIAWEIGTNDLPADDDRNMRIAREFEEALLAGSLVPLGAANLPDAGPIAVPVEAAPSSTDGRAFGLAQADVVDLAGTNIVQLSQLHDHFTAVADRWNAELHLPYCNEKAGEFRTPNFAGDIIEREYERAGAIRDRIAAEIEQRQPQGHWDADLQLETLVRHELLCNGDLRDPAIRARINAAWGA